METTEVPASSPREEGPKSIFSGKKDVLNQLAWVTDGCGTAAGAFSTASSVFSVAALKNSNNAEPCAALFVVSSAFWLAQGVAKQTHKFLKEKQARESGAEANADPKKTLLNQLAWATDGCGTAAGLTSLISSGFAVAALKNPTNALPCAAFYAVSSGFWTLQCLAKHTHRFLKREPAPEGADVKENTNPAKSFLNRLAALTDVCGTAAGDLSAASSGFAIAAVKDPAKALPGAVLFAVSSGFWLAQGVTKQTHRFLKERWAYRPLEFTHSTA